MGGMYIACNVCLSTCMCGKRVGVHCVCTLSNCTRCIHIVYTPLHAHPLHLPHTLLRLLARPSLCSPSPPCPVTSLSPPPLCAAAAADVVVGGAPCCADVCCADVCCATSVVRRSRATRSIALYSKGVMLPSRRKCWALDLYRILCVHVKEHLNVCVCVSCGCA